MTASLDDTRLSPLTRGRDLLLAGDIGGTKTALAVFANLALKVLGTGSVYRRVHNWIATGANAPPRSMARGRLSR